MEGESDHVVLDLTSSEPDSDVNFDAFFADMPDFLALCSDDESEFDQEYLSTSQLDRTCASIDFDPSEG